MKKITEEVQEAARRLAATKNSKEAYDQCLYDFEMGAYFGYTIAVNRVEEWLLENGYPEIVEQFKQAMTNYESK